MWKPPQIYLDIISKCPNLFIKDNVIQLNEIGWAGLIEDTSIAIESHLVKLPEEIRSQIFVEQIKSKFGGLRFYVSHETDFISGTIRLAERFSFRLCEKCGNTGYQLSIGNWIHTLCELHAQEEKTEHEKRIIEYMKEQDKRNELSKKRF